MEKRFSNIIQESAKGSLILITGQAISTIITAIGTIFVARVIGSTSYGLISIAAVPINIADILIQNGVYNAIVNFLVEARTEENQEKISSVIRAGFTINLGIGIVSTSTVFLISGYLSNQVYSNPELTPLIRILSLSCLARAIMTTSAAVIIGFEDMHLKSFLSIVDAILGSIIGPIFVLLGYGVIGAAYGRMSPYLISAVIALVIVLRKYQFKKSIVSDINIIKQIISYSYPLFFSRLLSRSLSQILNFIIPLYVTANLIGNLSAASNFTSLINLFIVPISTATFPLFSKLKPEDSVFEYVYQTVIKYETLIVYPIAGAVIALSDNLIRITYGSGYQYAAFNLQLLMLSFYTTGFGDSVSVRLITSQKSTQMVLKRTILYLISGLPLGLLLIPKYGILGYQAANLISPTIGLIYTLFWIRKTYNIKVNYTSTFKILISVILGYLACIVILRIIKMNVIIELVIGGAIFVIIYIISILMTGSITKKDVSDLRSVFSKYKQLKWFTDPVFSIVKNLAREN